LLHLRGIIAGGGTEGHIIPMLAAVLISNAGFADNCRPLAHNLHSMGWAGMTSRGQLTKAVERSREVLPPPPSYIFKTLSHLQNTLRTWAKSHSSRL
jgi:hypothetical protein